MTGPGKASDVEGEFSFSIRLRSRTSEAVLASVSTMWSLAGRAVRAALPERLGSGFRWLMASSWVSDLGDGIALAAGPLLVASQTDSPMLVAMAALLQRLPWLVFGLYAGVLADRLDRRLMVMACGLLQAAILAILSVMILTGRVNIGLVLTAMFLVGVTEVFAGNTTRTLLPMLVSRTDLGIANARLQAGFLTLNQLAGPALGAFLFAAASALPFSVQAVAAALGVALIARIGTAVGGVRGTKDTRAGRDVVEGFRWLARHNAVRTLAIVILAFNITWGAAWSVLVLYATRRLGMHSLGFGLLSTVGAAGGILATLSFGWLERHVPLATLMRGCLTLEVLTLLAFAVNRSASAALVIMFVVGAYSFVWGTVSRTVRQRAVPIGLQGRVGSVYMVGLYGGLVAGQALGGVLAEHGGLTAPFWFAFAGSGLTLALVWRSLGHIARADQNIA